MDPMKQIDLKSALIGVFVTTTVLLSLGATGPQDEGVKSPSWDKSQKWEWTILPFVDADGLKRVGDAGYEFVGCDQKLRTSVWRRRIK
ncbi:MAG: hypothetical protein CMN06_12030 [Roseibacillus sp.]|nr:hypothetical protein [Roseibacillus sp.]|tara:strand:+ start:555 stop:818 length:264 start_codon:yes stop_codon:yes gene_type:complete